MALQLPSSFADTLRSKFSSSRESGALVFTESTVKNVVDGDILVSCPLILVGHMLYTDFPLV